MVKKTIIIYVLFALAFQHCAKKVVVKSSEGKYTEDLARYRPEAPPVEAQLPEVPTREKVPNVKPTNHITKPLAAVIDSIAGYSARMPIDVYTVQVYTGRSREEANEIRQQIYRLLPGENPKLAYVQPNFKVRVGEYSSRIEANKTFTELRRHFPGAMLVPERIFPGE